MVNIDGLQPSTSHFKALHKQTRILCPCTLQEKNGVREKYYKVTISNEQNLFGDWDAILQSRQ
jgi:hypothetical protein